MKDLLERIRRLNRKPTDGEVDVFVAEHGPNLSIELLEEALKRYKEARKKILAGDLLEWMQENDLTELETEDFRVKIETYVSAKVSDEDAAFKWLDDHEYGDLIKDTLDLARGELTEEVRNALAELGVSYTQKSGIHPQTLKKVMSDRLKAEEDLPGEDAGFDVKFHDECSVKEL